MRREDEAEPVASDHGAAGVMQSETKETGQARGRPLRRLALAVVTPGSYGMVLVMIVATYVATVSLTGPRGPSIIVLMQVVTVWFALRASKARRAIRVGAGVILVLALLTALGSAIGSPQETWRGLPIVSALLYLVAPVSIIRHLVTRPGIDQETILGALAAYLLIGMFFAFTYRGIAVWQGGPFFGTQGEGTMPQILFFSFTTLTTTGYGNLVPAGNPGQTFAVSEMLLGQLFLVTAFGKVVSAWRPRRWSALSSAATPDAEAGPTEGSPEP